MKQSFSDRLTPAQIQTVFDALEIDWRPIYDPDNDGWVNLYADGYNFNSDLSVNIFHGGFVDQYSAGHPDPEIDGIPIRGDLVTLVSWLIYESRDPIKGIEWIKQVLGFKDGLKPPELQHGFHFANDWLSKDKKFVRMPRSILQSDLKASAKIVWMEIFDRVGKTETYSFAGVRNISKRTGLATSTVQRSLDELEEAGLIIQKPARVGQKYQRFPIVAETSVINEKLRGKPETVPKMNTGCTQSEHGDVFKMNTELDPFNETQVTIPKELISAKQVYAPNLFFLTFKQSQLKYQQACKNGYNIYTGKIFDERGYPAEWDFNYN